MTTCDQDKVAFRLHEVIVVQGLRLAQLYVEHFAEYGSLKR